MKNLRNVDLNLLIAFDAMMHERNVTRAAERVALSQPAMSNALSRLRHLLNDQLFVRTGSGMQPTLRAEQLWVPIARILEDIETTLYTSVEFDPLQDNRTFTLATTDYVESVLLETLHNELYRRAPGIKLTVRPLSADMQPKDIEEANIDFVVAHIPIVPNEYSRETIFMEEMICAVRATNPIIKGDDISLEDYLALDHLLISPKGSGKSMVDAALDAMSMKRNVAMRVPHFLVAPLILRNSDMICTLPRRIGEVFSEAGWIKLLTPPLPVPPFGIDLFWQKRFESDAAVMWFKDLIIDVGRRL